MTDLVITAANVKASDKAHRIRGIFGATVQQGDVCFSDTSANSKFKLADCNASAATSKAAGIAITAGADGQDAILVDDDPEFTPGATMVVGEAYFLSPNAGKLCPYNDLSSGHFPVFLLVAYSTTQGSLKIVRGSTAK